MFGRKKNKKPQTQSSIPESIQALQRGMNSVPDIISPSSIEVDFNNIRIGEKLHKTFFVAGYPRYVNPNWLEPLVKFYHPIGNFLFIYPFQKHDEVSALKQKI